MRKCRKVLCLLLTLLTLCLGGCSSQSVSIGSRAVVKLLYVEKTPGGYIAVAGIGSGKTAADAGEVSGAVSFFSAQGKTLKEAVEKAASEAGGKPFYAQDEALLLGPTLAGEELRQVLNEFSSQEFGTGNPAVYLWKGGSQKLLELEEPMSLIDAVNQCTASSEGLNGSVERISEYDIAGENFSAALPVLYIKQENPVTVAIGGEAFFTDEGYLLYVDVEEALCCALLRGACSETMWTFRDENGVRQTVSIAKLHRSFSVRRDKGGMVMRVSGIVYSGETDAKTRQALSEALNRSLDDRASETLGHLKGLKPAQLLDWEWWSRRLSAKNADDTQIVFDVAFLPL